MTKGCTDVVTANVIVNPLPTVTAGDDEEICFGDAIQLTATAGAGDGNFTYLWSNGETTASITVSPTTTTTYTVTVKDGELCEATDDVKVTVLELPIVTDVSSTNPTCGEDNGTITVEFSPVAGRTEIQISLDGGATYQPAALLADGSQTFTGLDADSYDLFARFAGGDCPIDIEDAELTDEKRAGSNRFRR